MILSRLKITLLSMAALLLCVATADAQKKNNVSLKKATAWTEAGEWRNGFDAMPDKTVNLQEFYSQYHKNKAQYHRQTAARERYALLLVKLLHSLAVFLLIVAVFLFKLI